jgi:hypothetical protein
VFICDICLGDGNCKKCDKDIENSEELIFLIDEIKCIDTCVICLCEEYMKKTCKKCKCFVNNEKIDVNTIPEYIELKKINVTLNNRIISLENEKEIQKLELKSNIEDNVLFKELKESNEKYKKEINSLNEEINIFKNKKDRPSKSNVKKNKNKYNRAEKVTLNKCLYNRFKKESEENIYYYGNYFNTLLNNNLGPNLSFGTLIKEYEDEKHVKNLANAKNKLKKACKKIKIYKHFIDELNIKKEYNRNIKKLYNKIINNIDNTFNVKIDNPKNEIEKFFSINIKSKYDDIDSQSNLGCLFIKENINNKIDLKTYIKNNNNLYLNSLINNENRISRFIAFCKRIYKLNKYISIDTIMYCRFLNDIRDISDDIFLNLIEKVDNYSKNKNTRLLDFDYILDDEPVGKKSITRLVF